MSLINVERIKLFTTKSPYWCLVGILAASALFAVLAGLVEQGRNAVPNFSLGGLGLSQSVFMVLAALAITTEYRFNTIRTTFLASPNRTAVLAAKSVLIAGIGLVVGFVCAIGAFFLTKVLAKQPPLPLDLDGDMWRIVAGWAPIIALSGVFAVAIGSIVRQTAGAVAIVLLWPVVENLLGLIPTVGAKIQVWLPFHTASRFVQDTRVIRTDRADFSAVPGSGPSAWGGLAMFVAYTVVIWVIALVLLRRRDA